MGLPGLFLRRVFFERGSLAGVPIDSLWRPPHPMLRSTDPLIWQAAECLDLKWDAGLPETRVGQY